MTTFYLVRHAETAFNGERRLQGWIDGPDNQLLPGGRERAKEAAAYLRDVALDAVVVSPIKRARDTAALVTESRRLPWVFSPALREVDFGQAEGWLMDDWIAHTKLGEMWRSFSYEAPFPGGESYLELWARSKALLEELVLRYEGGKVLLVSHATPVKFQLAALCGLDPKEAVHAWIPNAALYELHGTSLGSFTFSRLYPQSPPGGLGF